MPVLAGIACAACRNFWPDVRFVRTFEGSSRAVREYGPPMPMCLPCRQISRPRWKWHLAEEALEVDRERKEV